LIFIIVKSTFAQGISRPYQNIDIQEPVEYIVGGIKISGVKYLDEKALIKISGLSKGDRIQIPGEEIKKIIEKYWEQGLFSDVEIKSEKTVGDSIYLDIYLQERPRIAEFSIQGVKKSEKKDIKEKLEIKRGTQITDNLLSKTKKTIKDYFIEKGYLNVEIETIKNDAPNIQNQIVLKLIVNKNERVKIKDIYIKGNDAYSDWRLERKLKKTKEKSLLNIFSSSKYIEDLYQEDKDKLIDFYNKNGYRDAKIINDSISVLSKDRINLYITLKEGSKYYYGDIEWIGNTIYSSDQLSRVLGISRGDVYDEALMEKRLFQAQDAVTSLYLDKGYLFSNIQPVEVAVKNDSIDYEMRIYEGKQATINEVIIEGNTKTNEHVIRRELRTIPGDLFSKQDIIRSVRELSQLGFFDPEQISPNPIPNQADGTVDIKYNLVEKSTDQLEVSGGWGAGMLVGTIGLRFNNFASKDLFNPKAWKPIPSGDGEKLSLRAQSNGSYYQSYNITFVEPWFGGKRPNDFSVSLYHSIRNNSRYFTQKSDQYLRITGASVGLGRRLRWPDDFFLMYNELSYQRYNLKDWFGYFIFDNGYSNNVSFKTKFSRNSIDQPIYPRRGSSFSLSLQLTPPYSLIKSDVDYTSLSDQEKYRWIEYHKWKFQSKWYKRLVGDLVLYSRAEFGYLGHYNDEIGPSPFEGFDVGGDGLTGYNLYGRETIALRGYENYSLTPRINGNKSGNVYDKFTMELRFPFLLKPSATIFGLAFVEAGNCWYDIESFSPYDIKRSAGFGIRAFLPMFGLLGVDWGYGFDEIKGMPGVNGPQFHFTIGQEF
jgi:outer membrane protein insertion porin family